MLIYEDLEFDLYAEDDSNEVTCRMCGKDCPLCYMQDGLCPACFSLCSSAPTREDAYTKRAHLVNLTRRAYVAWGEAVALLSMCETALRPSQSCIDEARELVAHRFRRYNLLETKLADATRLCKCGVMNEISQFPDCARLLTRNL